MTVPDALTLSSEHLRESKLYLFENGHEILIKIESQVALYLLNGQTCEQVPSETLQALFGFSQVNVKGPEPTVIVSDHPLNARLHKLLNALRSYPTLSPLTPSAECVRVPICRCVFV